jgi:hypothetical protein
MRTMEIPSFRKRVELSEIESLTKDRLTEKFQRSEQAVPLAGYMFYPNDDDARLTLTSVLRSSPDPLWTNLKGMHRIQYRWIRAADVFNLYYDIAIGGHQSRRGGATISKAAHLAAKNTKSLGTSEPTFWSAWSAYKDVAPLVTATILIWANALIMGPEDVAAFRWHDDAEPIVLDQLSPFHVTMLMPDLVLAVARSFEDFALTKVSSRDDAGPNPETLWRIPPDVNVVPFPPPSRKIRSVDKIILNARRAGNRGGRNKPHADPTLPRPL